MPDQVDPCNVARQDLMQHPPEDDLATEIRSVLFRAEMDNGLPPELGRVAARLDELLAREVARNKGVLGCLLLEARGLCSLMEARRLTRVAESYEHLVYLKRGQERDDA